MPHSTAQTDSRASVNEGPLGEESSDGTAFGEREPTRFGADVEYRGTARDHQYVVRVRHRLLDTTATVIIDGVEHDPKAEEKALKAAEKDRAEASAQDGAGEKETPTQESSEVEVSAQEPPAAPQQPGGEGEEPADGLRFRYEEGFTSLRITVLRPDADGDHGDAEQIRVRTAGLGGVGEVEVQRGFSRVVLAPEDGSPSAAWEEKRTEHPTRYALLAALAKSARYLIPLLGFGALFSGLLDPVEAWVEERVRPIVEAVAAFLTPIGEWLSELTRPSREFLAAMLRPVAEFWSWLMDVLFGWIPDLSLPFSIPDWVLEVALPLLIVVLVFVATFRELRARRQKLKAARDAQTAKDTSAAGAGTADDDAAEPDGDAGEPDETADSCVESDAAADGTDRPIG